MIKAVLFDLDGTLVDTELLSARAWLASGERLGLDVSEELIKSFVGRTADAVTNMLVEHLGITEATAHELFSLHRSIKEELMENELAAKPFAAKALSVLKDHGFALGLATSSYRPVAERELEPFGMQAYFDSITCGDEIKHGKPARCRTPRHAARGVRSRRGFPQRGSRGSRSWHVGLLGAGYD